MVRLNQLNMGQNKIHQIGEKKTNQLQKKKINNK